MVLPSGAPCEPVLLAPGGLDCDGTAAGVWKAIFKVKPYLHNTIVKMGVQITAYPDRPGLYNLLLSLFVFIPDRITVICR